MSWPKVKISDLVEPISKWNPKASPSAPPFTYIDLSSIDKERKLIHETANIYPSEAPSRARQLVQENDVLVSTVRPNLNGVAMIAPEYDGATASTGYCVLRPIPEKILPSFLFHWVKTPHFISEMTRNSTGANYPAVSDKTIKEHLISLPPIEEQERIAAILDKTNDIHRNSELGASLQNELISNVFLEMFGDPRINEKNWPTKPLIEVATLQRGFDLPVQNRMPGSVPILASNGPAGYHNEIKVNGPGVVTGRSGSLGNVQFVEQGYWPLNTSLWVKNFHGNESRWIAHLLRHMNLQNFTRGSGVPTLNRNLVHVVDVIHPPIELQKKFAAYEISIQSTFESIISSSRKSTTLVSSITQEMLQ